VGTGPQLGEVRRGRGVVHRQRLEEGEGPNGLAPPDRGRRGAGPRVRERGVARGVFGRAGLLGQMGLEQAERGGGKALGRFGSRPGCLSFSFFSISISISFPI